MLVASLTWWRGFPENVGGSGRQQRSRVFDFPRGRLGACSSLIHRCAQVQGVTHPRSLDHSCCAARFRPRVVTIFFSSARCRNSVSMRLLHAPRCSLVASRTSSALKPSKRPSDFLVGVLGRAAVVSECREGRREALTGTMRTGG